MEKVMGKVAPSRPGEVRNWTRIGVWFVLFIACRADRQYSETKKHASRTTSISRRPHLTWVESIRSFDILQELLLYRGRSENAIVVTALNPEGTVFNRKQFVFLQAYFALCSLSQFQGRSAHFDLVAFIGPLPQSAKEKLQATGANLIDVSGFPMDRWFNPRYKATGSGFIPQSRTDGGRTSVKFLAWLLMGYKKVLVVDADTFWFEDPGHIFASESHLTAFKEHYMEKHISGGKKEGVGLNTHAMLIKPSPQVFMKLMSATATHEYVDRTNTEQDVIESLYFESTSFWKDGGTDVERIPNHYHGKLGLNMEKWMKVKNMTDVEQYVSLATSDCKTSFEDIALTIQKMLQLFPNSMV